MIDPVAALRNGHAPVADPDEVARLTASALARADREGLVEVAVATDGNGRFTQLDPYAGAQLALAEAYRNVACGGAMPVAVSDCLNFGSPEDPAVMWQFAEACRGLKDACAALGVPVTGGNVSLYNQTGDAAILPTPVVAVLPKRTRCCCPLSLERQHRQLARLETPNF